MTDEEGAVRLAIRKNEAINHEWKERTTTHIRRRTGICGKSDADSMLPARQPLRVSLRMKSAVTGEPPPLTSPSRGD